MELKKGLYESLVNQFISEKIEQLPDNLDASIESIDSSESSEIISAYMKNILEKGLNSCSNKNKFEKIEKQLAISNKLLNLFSELIEDEEFRGFLVKESSLLKAVAEKSSKNKDISKVHPLTSVSRSSLFTGSANEPTVYSELNREILTSDRVDLLVSFIKYSGLRLIIDSLREHTKSKALRIITTSYMGASDYKAVKMLSELPNTEVKVSYDTKRTRLHAKAYYFHRDTGFSTAYIGSSNMSKSALTEGTEWNLKVSEYSSPEILEKYRATFESYWNSSEFKSFNPGNLEDNLLLKESLSVEYRTDKPHISFDIRPYGYQQEMLDKLEVERELHNSRKNLLVAATGTGKTVVSAFDFKRYYIENPSCRLLFLSHRKEILIQSVETFHWILKDQNFGDLWVAEYSPSSYNHLFASVQTLNSNSKYTEFSKDYFDFIVLDETHHGASDSYASILNYFEPDILLGLTATPERMDGGDILKYFNDRIAYEVRLHDAIDRKLLCPFHYFGVTDSVNLSDLKWSRGRYDIGELDGVYTGNDRRADLIIQSLDKYLPDLESTKGIGFCVSKTHAAYMSDYFNSRGIPSISLDSNSPAADRSGAKSKLQRGEVKFIFVVDLYNEGVDIPEINTVLFLRPTESATVFIQQLGRGLRISDYKDVLTVLDFVGQCNKEFSFKTKLRHLIGKSDQSVEREIANEFPNLPSGCYMQLEKKAREYILDNLKKTYINKNRLKKMVSNYRYETNRPLNFSNFLDHYNISQFDIYKTTSFGELCNTEGLDKDYMADDIKRLKNALPRIASLDSLKFIDFLLTYLKREDYSLDNLSDEELLMLTMFHYTVWTESPGGDLLGHLNRLRKHNPSILNEIIGLLEYNKRNIDFLEHDVDLSFPCPLTLHSSYTTDQILAAMGEHTVDSKKSFREGVLYVKNKDIDIFFITLNKSEKDFSTSTQYEDYAISESLFHWQSQSRTSDTSPTGLRYIGQRKSRHHVLLFVRENKVKYSTASPYHFLGKANYFSHNGSKPISIVWELEKPIPAQLLKQSNKLVDII